MNKEYDLLIERIAAIIEDTEFDHPRLRRKVKTIDAMSFVFCAHLGKDAGLKRTREVIRLIAKNVIDQTN